MALAITQVRQFSTTEQVTSTKLNDIASTSTISGILGTNLDSAAGIDIAQIDWAGANADIGIIRTSTTTNIFSITGSSLTTGSLGCFYSNSADTSARNLVSIVNDNSAAVGATCLNIQQDADHTALNITGGANSTGYDVNITSGAVAGGVALNVTGDTLGASGQLANFSSNSADVGARNLVSIVNDNSAAVGAVPLTIQQDAVVSTNYKKLITAGGVTIWCSNGTNTPNGALTGTAGDICLNADSSKSYYCTGTTSWTAM